MADRICSFCRENYTDEEGHDYDRCVERCEEELPLAKEGLVFAARRFVDAESHLAEAKKVQKSDSWKTG